MQGERCREGRTVLVGRGVHEEIKSGRMKAKGEEGERERVEKRFKSAGRKREGEGSIA